MAKVSYDLTGSHIHQSSSSNTSRYTNTEMNEPAYKTNRGPDEEIGFKDGSTSGTSSRRESSRSYTRSYTNTDMNEPAYKTNRGPDENVGFKDGSTSGTSSRRESSRSYTRSYTNTEMNEPAYKTNRGPDENVGFKDGSTSGTSSRRESSRSYTRSYTNTEMNEPAYKTNRNPDENVGFKDGSTSGTSSRRESSRSYTRTYANTEMRDPAPYPKTNQPIDDMDVRLIQPGRQGPASYETDSVQTDSSQIPMGLEILKDVDRFIIRQNFQSEAWWDTVRFQVEDGRGKQILEIRQEKADNGCVQAILGKMRQYFMKVYYATRNEWIMEFEHPWSCSSPIFCPWASPSMIVRMPTGEVLGQVKNASRETCGSCLPPTKYFNVFNYDGSIINAVTGPTCYPFECTSSNPASFELLKVENSGKTLRVGSIDHQWRGACGGLSSCCITEEQETVSLTFRKDCSVEDKALFLSLGFLMLFTFFEVK